MIYIARFMLSLLLSVFTYDVVAQLCPAENTLPQRSSSRNLIRGHFSFTINFLDALQQFTPNENVIFSPYSMFHTLLLAYFGAEGETERELVNLLGLQWAKNKHEVYVAYRFEQELRDQKNKRASLEFLSAEKIFIDQEIELNGCIGDLFKNEIETLDIRGAPVKSGHVINNWAAYRTKNELRELLNANDTIKESASLLLTNIAAFTVLWDNEFDPRNTRKSVFYATALKQSIVTMMQRRGEVDLTIDEDLRAYVIIMPYANVPERQRATEVVMILLLPPYVDNALDTTLRRLTVERLEHAIKESVTQQVDISLPKFQLEIQQDIEPVIRNIGLGSLFDENTADLSGFSNTSRKLKFQGFKHAAKITMDEKGRSSNAPAVSYRLPNDPREVTFNHPFLFLIYDKSVQTVLFAGIIRDPR